MGDPNPTTGTGTASEAPPQPEVEKTPTQSDPSTSIASPSSNPGAVVNPPTPSIVTPPSPAIHPSFRPPVAPHFFPASGYSTMPPGVVGPPQPQPYGVTGQAVRYVAPPMPNGYPLAAAPPPGVPRYPNPYAPMIRLGFPPRPMVGVLPQLARPPIIGIRGPIIAPVVRPPTVASASPAEEPQKTVYVGKLLPTVENDFMLSLLQLCGPVKNWKRPHGTTGALRGFGFCEFESAEGVLRALRLLNKLSVDGQELMLNVGDETREYLKRYVEKRIESIQNGEGSKAEVTGKEDSSAPVAVANESTKLAVESSKPSSDELEKEESNMDKKNPDATNFGIVTDEDREADQEALEKINSMIEERLKNKPIPPPPPPRDVDASTNINSEHSGSRDREAENIAKNEDQSEDEKNAESKPSNEPGKTETDSPDRSRRRERSRDRDRDVRRDKERELERYEREREQERAKREKEREYKSREDERRYKAREKEWEAREREREHWRKRERERERDRAQDRKWEVMDQERDDDDGYGKKRKYRTSDEERRRRQREREDDWADRLREEEEIAEAKEREEEERQRKEAEALRATTEQQLANGPEQQANEENDDKEGQTFDNEPSHAFSYAASDGIQQNGAADESSALYNASLDVRQNNVPTSRKLGFGLSGSGKRAAVPSVFEADEDEDGHKEKKMRPLVPIDYTSEEQQAVPSISDDPYATTMVDSAAAGFVKRSSAVGSKEEKPDVEKDKSKRSHERSGHRDRDRHEEETSGRERTSRTKTPENQKPLAKQLIDTIPKTKDDLFSYKINWSIYDQNELHEQLRPWVSKKITDYLGEEEVTLVDYIVSSTQEHVDAAEMLERLQTILDDEAEMFVLKMWRMLIFEIKKVENGLTVKSRS